MCGSSCLLYIKNLTANLITRYKPVTMQRSKLWEHFKTVECSPHKAICNYCDKVVSRGKEGGKCLGNKAMNNHLKRIHPDAFNEYEVARNKTTADPKDETRRGSVPLFNLKNHGERAEFLKLVSNI